ncbi:diguanylate cyclase [Rhizobium giardinii]|uniref:GGDEF domain-containing protein n=1 Tax=Rhizobium giardinii TaxID=56731 RepID=UPI003D6E2C65
MNRNSIDGFINSDTARRINKVTKLRDQSQPKTGTLAAIRSNLTLNHRLSIGICLAIVCTTILAMTIISRSYSDFSVARQNLDDIQNYRLVLDTANHLSAERGPANIIMSENPRPNGAVVKRLIEFRARTDNALAHLAAIRAPLGFHPIPAPMLAGVRQQLYLARSKVDRIGSMPRNTRKLVDIQDAIQAMFEVVDRFQQVVAWNANELVQHDSGLAASVLIGQMLGDLREYGGRVASQIMAPIIVEQQLPLQNVVDSRRSQGRLLELWKLVSGQAALYDVPALAQGRQEVEHRFLGQGLGMINGLIDEGLRGTGYSLSATQFTERFVPTLQPLERYRSVFLDAAVGKFDQQKNRALVLLAVTVLVTAAILAILVGLVLAVQIHIFRPLLHAREDVIRLAEDRPTEARSSFALVGEMLRLFDAIDILQDRLRQRAFITSEFKAQAETDSLTGLLNRRVLNRVGENEAAGTFTSDAIGLILIDIDYFKAINDTHGHPAGDRVLIETADLLRSLLRSTDLVARFGGEEFAILIPGGSLAGALSIARQIRLALQRHPFMTPDGVFISVTASFGVACGRRGPGEWSRLVERADKALYCAKSDGRNRVRFSRTSLDEQSLTPPSENVGLVPLQVLS